jgi:hypothetical protein
VGVFLAVALLLILMNGLFFYILRNAVRRLGKFSRLNLIHQANIYDEFMENKEAELEELLARAKSAAENSVPPSAARGREQRAKGPDVSGIFALLRDRRETGSFTGAYKLLRGGVLADKTASVDAAMELIEKARGGASGAAARRNPALEILSMFDLDARYALCCLSEGEAFRILKELLADSEHSALLEEYLEGEEEGGVIGFFDGLRVKSFLRAPEIVIRSGSKGDVFRSAANDGRAAVTEYDESVCEGIYAISGGRLYDYSVRNGEIGG